MASANPSKPHVLTQLTTLFLLSTVSWPLAAASLESLIMPGPVIEGHAELEEECGACHDRFGGGDQRTLCLDCHERVAADVSAEEGFHGHHPEIGSVECSQCHTEHKGRDADVVGLVAELFDHGYTDFPLDGAHATSACSSCHEAGAGYFEAPSACASCHDSDDAHAGNLGAECNDCHQTDSWASAEFDHASTDFELIGAHAEARCESCHVDQLYEGTGSECVSCHQLDDVHGGSRGDACGDCHDSRSWDASFDHFAETGFALNGEHGELNCRNCHVSQSSYEGLSSDCQGCHAGDDPHLGRNGSDCAQCHSESSWEVAFDHGAETGFALEGAHTEAACTQCHTGQLTDPVATDCWGCHEGDDPHAGSLLECQECHSNATWSQEIRFIHDLTSFALVGLHRTVSCEQCHDTLVFAPEESRCSACHDEDDVHSGSLGDQCDSCHNPVGWSYWDFDHSLTEFPLTGAHQNLTCESCHESTDRLSSLPTVCSSCHRADDVHRGAFGPKCDRCHNPESFSEPLSER